MSRDRTPIDRAKDEARASERNRVAWNLPRAVPAKPRNAHAQTRDESAEVRGATTKRPPGS